ncbi:1538_t:CDS:2, partial [Cetraspora pellucida]
AVSIDNNISMNNLNSNSESNFEIKTDNIMPSEKLNNIIKHLEREIKSNKHNKSFLHANKWNVNLDELANHVNKKVLSSLCYNLLSTISIRTARKWLREFSFEYSE